MATGDRSCVNKKPNDRMRLPQWRGRKTLSFLTYHFLICKILNLGFLRGSTRNFTFYRRIFTKPYLSLYSLILRRSVSLVRGAHLRSSALRLHCNFNFRWNATEASRWQHCVWFGRPGNWTQYLALQSPQSKPLDYRGGRYSQKYV